MHDPVGTFGAEWVVGAMRAIDDGSSDVRVRLLQDVDELAEYREFTLLILLNLNSS